MAVYDPNPLKRKSTNPLFEESPAKKLNRGLVRHHKAQWNLQQEQRLNAPVQDEESVQMLLTRSIGLALEAVGFEAAAHSAMETMRVTVEECTRDGHHRSLCAFGADVPRYGALPGRRSTDHALESPNAGNSSGLPPGLTYTSA